MTGEELRNGIRIQFDAMLKKHPDYEIVLRETSDDQFRKYVLIQLHAIYQTAEAAIDDNQLAERIEKVVETIDIQYAEDIDREAVILELRDIARELRQR